MSPSSSSTKNQLFTLWWSHKTIFLSKFSFFYSQFPSPIPLQRISYSLFDIQAKQDLCLNCLICKIGLVPSLVRVAQLVRALSWNQKVVGLTLGPGTCLGCIWSLIQANAGGNQSMLLSHIDISLSLFLSP